MELLLTRLLYPLFPQTARLAECILQLFWQHAVLVDLWLPIHYDAITFIILLVQNTTNKTGNPLLWLSPLVASFLEVAFIASERPLTNGLTDENHGAIYVRS